MRTWRRLLLACGLSVFGGTCFLACGSDDQHLRRAENGGESSGRGGEPGDAQAPGGAGGSADTGVAGAQSVEDDLGFLKELCDRFAQTECQGREDCYGADPVCLTQTTGYCHLYARAELLPALKAGLIEYDAAKADACLGGVPAGFCGTNNLWYLKSCREMFRGTGGADDPCYRVYFLSNTIDTCAEGQCDAKPQTECGSGRCVPFLADDADCVDAEGVRVEPGCGPGRLCDYPSKRCVAEKVLHEACTSLGEACNYDLPRLFCVPKADGSDALECDAPRPTGSVCGAIGGPQASIACESLICKEGKCIDESETGESYCLAGDRVCPAGQVCFAKPDYPVCGDAITEGGACSTIGRECAAGLACVASGEPTENMGTCQPLAEEGEDCLAIGCAEGLRCVGDDTASSCAPIVEAGGSCESSNECADGLDCLEGPKTCGVPALIGAACQADGDCEGGLFCGDDAKTCRPWKRNGEACTRQQECIYNNGCTDDGVCESLCTP
jgi:hypothetical protein